VGAPGAATIRAAVTNPGLERMLTAILEPPVPFAPKMTKKFQFSIGSQILRLLLHLRKKVRRRLGDEKGIRRVIYQMI